MAFRFPLETLLRVRQGLERQQELRLQQTNLRVGSVVRQIEEVQHAVKNIDLSRQTQMKSAISGAEMHFATLCCEVLKVHELDLEKQLAEAAAVRTSCVANLQHARREREAIDTLRRHQFQNYQLQESRQDQRRLDDLYLLRRTYLRRS